MCQECLDPGRQIEMGKKTNDIEWYRRAAEQEHPEAWSRIGLTLVARTRPEEGIRILEQEYKKRIPLASLFLGACYYNGKGVEKNERRAFDLFFEASTLGIPEGDLRLGDCFMKGIGVEKNEKVAFLLYTKVRHFYEAEVKIAECYLNGTGVEQDQVKAFEGFRKFLAKSEVARYRYAECLYKGVGCVQNREIAIVRFRKEAENDSLEAQQILGYCLLQGTDVKRDVNEAFKWLLKASRGGNPCTQYNLGICYQDGLGVEKNEDLATMWFERAATQRAWKKYSV